MDYNKLIEQTCDEIKQLLIQKNTAYGNSVFKPVSKFGISISPVDAIIARMSDKEARIANKGFNDLTEDTHKDLIGYHILLHIVLSLGYLNNQEE
jgi:hypothetical protein